MEVGSLPIAASTASRPGRQLDTKLTAGMVRLCGLKGSIVAAGCYHVLSPVAAPARDIHSLADDS